MRLRCLLLLLVSPLTFAQTHFKTMRPVTVSEPAKQSYIVMDETLLAHVRPDMGDIRLYSASGREVPYLLRTQRASRYSTWNPAKLLNKGASNGQTQFILDISEPEYDSINFDLSTTDFVARAAIEGADDVATKTWNSLGTFSLYDFSKEKLGSSAIVRLKTPVLYRFLRVTINGPVPPEDVMHASIANFQEDKAQYVVLSSPVGIRQQGNRTIATWNTSERLPVERIAVEVPATEVNFSRDVALFCDERLVSSSELSRVHMERKGRLIESESLAIEPYGIRCKSYKLAIANGDNPPLNISSVKPMMLERRIYFDPRNESEFKLYYGDEKTGAPVYDYARFFEPADAGKVAAAEMKVESANPSFAERPDDRPLSERYKAVLWIAMLVAVGLLGVWALKGFKS